MKRYHISESGPSICTAKPGNCPLNTEHGSLEEMREIWEKKNKPFEVPKALKKVSKQKVFLNPFDDSEYAEKIKRKLEEYPEEINGNPVGIHVLSGSNLYGLAHKDSDLDTFTVLVNKVNNNKKYYIKQSINGEDDTVLSDFRSFVLKAQEGTPQFLEAMFAENPANKFKDYEGFRKGFHAGTNAIDVYRRTIKNFAITDNDPLKRKRHALRLADNLNEMLVNNGRFNPTLSIEKAKLFTDAAHSDEEDYFEFLKSYSRVEINFEEDPA